MGVSKLIISTLVCLHCNIAAAKEPEWLKVAGGSFGGFYIDTNSIKVHGNKVTLIFMADAQSPQTHLATLSTKSYWTVYCSTHKYTINKEIAYDGHMGIGKIVGTKQEDDKSQHTISTGGIEDVIAQRVCSH